MMKLLSVYLDSRVAQTWRAAVKQLDKKQGPAMDEALRDWLDKYRTEIKEVAQLPDSTVSS